MSVLCSIGEFIVNWPWVTIIILILLAVSVSSSGPLLAHQSIYAHYSHGFPQYPLRNHKKPETPKEDSHGFSDPDQNDHQSTGPMQANCESISSTTDPRSSDESARIDYSNNHTLAVLPSVTANPKSPLKNITFHTHSGEKVAFHSIEPQERPVIAEYRQELEKKNTDLAWLRREHRQLQASILGIEERAEEQIRYMREQYEKQLAELRTENLNLNDHILAEEQRYRGQTANQCREHNLQLKLTKPQQDAIRDLEDMYRKLALAYKNAHHTARTAKENRIEELGEDNLEMILQMFDDLQKGHTAQLEEVERLRGENEALTLNVQDLADIAQDRDRLKDAVEHERQWTNHFQTVAIGLTHDLKQEVANNEKSKIDLQELQKASSDQIKKMQATMNVLESDLDKARRQNEFDMMVNKAKLKDASENYLNVVGNLEKLRSDLKKKEAEIESLRADLEDWDAAFRVTEAMKQKAVTDFENAVSPIEQFIVGMKVTEEQQKFKIMRMGETIKNQRARAEEEAAKRDERYEELLFKNMEMASAKNQEYTTLQKECNELWFRYNYLLQEYLYWKTECDKLRWRDSERSANDVEMIDVFENEPDVSSTESEEETDDEKDESTEDTTDFQEVSEALTIIQDVVRAIVKREVELLTIQRTEAPNVETLNLLEQNSLQNALKDLGLENLVDLVSQGVSENAHGQQSTTDQDTNSPDPTQSSHSEPDETQLQASSSEPSTAGNTLQLTMTRRSGGKDGNVHDRSSKSPTEQTELLNIGKSSRFDVIDPNQAAAKSINAEPPVQTEEDFLYFRKHQLCIWCGSPRHQNKSHCTTYQYLKNARLCEMCHEHYGDRKRQHEEICPQLNILKLSRAWVLRNLSADSGKGSSTFAKRRVGPADKARRRAASREGSQQSSPASSRTSSRSQPETSGSQDD